jgi:hypothetical protein
MGKIDFQDQMGYEILRKIQKEMWISKHYNRNEDCFQWAHWYNQESIVNLKIGQ